MLFDKKAVFREAAMTNHGSHFFSQHVDDDYAPQ